MEPLSSVVESYNSFFHIFIQYYTGIRFELQASLKIYPVDPAVVDGILYHAVTVFQTFF